MIFIDTYISSIIVASMQILFLFLTLFWQYRCEEKLPIVRQEYCDFHISYADNLSGKIESQQWKIVPVRDLLHFLSHHDVDDCWVSTVAGGGFSSDINVSVGLFSDDGISLYWKGCSQKHNELIRAFQPNKS